MTKDSLKSLARKILRPAVRRWDSFLDRFRQPKLIGIERIAGLDHLAGIFDSTILSAASEGNSTNHISLGRGVYLGRRVELEAGGPQGIEIDEDTSLQDGCAVRGQAKIGAHCLLGHNVLVISSSHRFLDNPEWLIRDQDREYQQARSEFTDKDDIIQIDDDCWFGWSCAVMPGVHIGRGAILAANSVIATDVAPYEVHGGIPNRKISNRLLFAPPASISALNDSDLPYFYAGFRHARETLGTSRANQVILARASAIIVLAGLAQPRVILRGVRFDGSSTFTLRFWLNGIDAGCHSIPIGAFELILSASNSRLVARSVAAGLRGHTVVQWQEEPRPDGSVSVFADSASTYGIASAEIF